MSGRQKFQWWVFGSAALMLIGAFGPWVKALAQSVGGTDGSNDGWLVVAAAVIGSLLFYASRTSRSAGVFVLLAGAAGLGITLYDRNNIQSKIDQGGALVKAFASVGWGLNLALIASASMTVAGLAWIITDPQAVAAPVLAPPPALPPPVAPPPVAAPPEN
jgi:hypothetical protein